MTGGGTSDEAALRLQLAVVLDALRLRDHARAEQMEWDFATQLQLEGLPQDFPAFPDRSEFDLRAGMVTAQEVGGDLYDFFMPTPDRLVFLVADASGKGLPAAMFITITRTLLRAAARRIADAGDCIGVVNSLLCFNNPEMMFVTAFYGCLDTTTGEIAYANAGHNPPLLLRSDGQVSELVAPRRPILGVVEGVSYPTARHRLAPGDTLVCFTDGVTEAHDPAGNLFDNRRLIEVLAGAQGLSLEEMLAAVVARVDRFMGVAPVADDLTVLLLRWLGTNAQQL